MSWGHAVSRDLLHLRRGPDGIRLVQVPVRELRSLRRGTEPRLVQESAGLPGSAEIELDPAAGIRP